jgi:hypothetical protein
MWGEERVDPFWNLALALNVIFTLVNPYPPKKLTIEFESPSEKDGCEQAKAKAKERAGRSGYFSAWAGIEYRILSPVMALIADHHGEECQPVGASGHHNLVRQRSNTISEPADFAQVATNAI